MEVSGTIRSDVQLALKVSGSFADMHYKSDMECLSALSEQPRRQFDFLIPRYAGSARAVTTADHTLAPIAVESFCSNFAAGDEQQQAGYGRGRDEKPAEHVVTLHTFPVKSAKKTAGYEPEPWVCASNSIQLPELQKVGLAKPDRDHNITVLRPAGPVLK